MPSNFIKQKVIFLSTPCSKNLKMKRSLQPQGNKILFFDKCDGGARLAQFGEHPLSNPVIGGWISSKAILGQLMSFPLRLWKKNKASNLDFSIFFAVYASNMNDHAIYVLDKKMEVTISDWAKGTCSQNNRSYDGWIFTSKSLLCHSTMKNTAIWWHHKPQTPQQVM